MVPLLSQAPIPCGFRWEGPGSLLSTEPREACDLGDGEWMVGAAPARECPEESLISPPWAAPRPDSSVPASLWPRGASALLRQARGARTAGAELGSGGSRRVLAPARSSQLPQPIREQRRLRRLAGRARRGEGTSAGGRARLSREPRTPAGARRSAPRAPRAPRPPRRGRTRRGRQSPRPPSPSQREPRTQPPRGRGSRI